MTTLVPLCPAPVGNQPHLAELPCAEHGIDDAAIGNALWGNVYIRYRCDLPGECWPDAATWTADA